MSREIGKWLLTVVVVALTANLADAESVPTNANTPAAASAAVFEKYYPTPLSSSPIGDTEDRAVWLAKVQGLLDTAPEWIQRNVLASRTKAEFSTNLALLEQLQKGLLDQGAVAVKSLTKAGKLRSKAATPNIGVDGNADLVYTTLEPCRIMDSRNATGGGLANPLVGNHLYQLPGYITSGSNWQTYGGNASSDCGLNDAVNVNIWAIAIVITILNPNFDAFLGISDSASLSVVLSSVALNYTRGQGLSTLYIVPQGLGNTIYFAMPAGLTANVIFDVVGYFATSQATALECQVASSAVTMVSNNVWTPVDASCPAGYTVTGGGFGTPETALAYPGVWTTGLPIGSLIWRTWVDNQTGSSRSVQTFAQCCRIPGR